MTSSGSDSTRLFQEADAYENFMGRYSRPLAHELAAAAGVEAGQRVLDVGCGTGALTTVLAEIVGPEQVAAADPSEPLVEECRARVPGADARVAAAEALPFADASFDRVLAQLVFHFVHDPARSAAEMVRVSRPGGLVATCVWDLTGGMTMLRAYWDAVREAGVEGRDEGERFGVRAGQLAEMWRDAGLRDVTDASLTIAASYRDFDELWASFRAGVGPAGAHAAALDGPTHDAVRDALRRNVGSPDGAFELSARAWYASGVV
jgi:SAM-dependent methyltransferase